MMGRGLEGGLLRPRPLRIFLHERSCKRGSCDDWMDGEDGALDPC